MVTLLQRSYIFEEERRASAGLIMEEVAHYADTIGGRARQWAVAFTFMDPAAKLELLCLLSFTVCVLGSLVVFPVRARHTSAPPQPFCLSPATSAHRPVLTATSPRPRWL